MNDVAVGLEAFKLHVKEAATAELLEEYGMYYAVRKYHLFDTEIESIKNEIIERCENESRTPEGN